MKKLALATALTIASALPVTAADWGGIYFGGATASNTGDYNLFGTNPVFTDPTYGLSGNMSSVFAGFNVDAGLLVYGIEFETTVLGTTPSTALAPNNADYLASVTDLKARAGYEMGNALIYATAGTSFGNFEYMTDMTAVSGMSYGIGIDLLITPTYFVGIEYLSRSMTGVVSAPDEVDVNVDSLSIRAGMLF